MPVCEICQYLLLHITDINIYSEDKESTKTFVLKTFPYWKFSSLTLETPSKNAMNFSVLTIMHSFNTVAIWICDA